MAQNKLFLYGTSRATTYGKIMKKFKYILAFVSLTFVLNIQADTKYNETFTDALFGKAASCDVQAVQDYIDSGLADINAREEYLTKHTPLIAAVSTGCIEVTELLIKAGADVNIVASGNYALTHAVYDGEVEIVQLLLAQPDIDLTLTSRHRGRVQTFLEIAQSKYADHTNHIKGFNSRIEKRRQNGEHINQNRVCEAKKFIKAYQKDSLEIITMLEQAGAK
jgi:ankyrin repeat protein